MKELGIALAIQKPEVSKEGKPNMGAEVEAILKAGGFRYRMPSRVDYGETKNIKSFFVWYMKNADLVNAVAGGFAGLAILGQDQLGEYTGETPPIVLKELGFSLCQLAVGVTTRKEFGELNNREYQDPIDLVNKTIVTKYPRGAARWLDKNNVPWIIRESFANQDMLNRARIVKVTGGAESIVSWGGIAQACVEIIEEGDTVTSNKILPIDEISTSQAVLVANPNLDKDQKYEETVWIALNKFMTGYWRSKFTLLEVNYPLEQEAYILDGLPARESPTKATLVNPAWAAAKVLIRESEADKWSDILEARGARDPLCTPVKVYPNLDDPEITGMMRVIYGNEWNPPTPHFSV